MFSEELTVCEEVMFTVEHAAVVAPRTIRELVKLTDNIPKLISRRVAHTYKIQVFTTSS